MKMRVLIAYDGSACADAALVDLQRAGLPQNAEVIVLSVADVCLWPDSNQNVAIPETANVKRARQLALHAVEEAQALAAKACQRIKASFSGWTVSSEACGESPAWAIIRKADEWKSDLIVVGSHGRSAVSRLILGSVSQQVVNEASCSVRVARGPVLPNHSSVRILLGVDGSPGAETAVHAVAERVWPAGSEARVIAALDPVMATATAWMKGDDQDADERAWVRQKVEAEVERLSLRKLAVSFALKEGDPKRVLIEEADQWKADCIFVGSRGLRRFERLLLGSVATAVVARAHCSVEVVRAGG
jgi:nucleotide-binding universal stress UspA family protein